MKIFSGLIMTIAFTAAVHAGSPSVRGNQIGYYPSSPGILIVDHDLDEIQIQNAGQEHTLKPSVPAQFWIPSGERVWVADFSSLNLKGDFQVLSKNTKLFQSQIIPHRKELIQSVVKSYYFQRANLNLEEKYAGKWARKKSDHEETASMHPDAASAQRVPGSVIPTPKGWYDAGDYGRYIVNSGVTVYSLLKIAQDFPKYTGELRMDIPSDDSQMPDLLKEIKWNLDWMLSMQDPADGGVYHKVTTKQFSGEIMPEQNTSPRFVMPKSTTAALTFAASVAMASRIYRPYSASFADTCLNAAKLAYAWAAQYPAVGFKNPADVNTGPYNYPGMSDENFWAAVELFRASGSKAYLTWIDKFFPAEAPIPFWGDTRALGLWSIMDSAEDFPDSMQNKAGKLLEDIATIMHNEIIASPYRLSLNPENFVWGSNSHVANSAMYMIQMALRSEGTEKAKWMSHASQFIDYLLGRNPHRITFITGFGHISPRQIHHRISAADSVSDPVPGLLAGGPHNGGQDVGDEVWKCKEYRNMKYPALSWIDDWCSYATNEVAINWNAPLAYSLIALDDFYGQK